MNNDVIVVGGGVMGSSVAYHLKSDPAFTGKVTVIERDPTYARASSALTSPFTVRVFDAGKTADGERYLVSEAVLGRGLDALLPIAQVAQVAAARAEVLGVILVAGSIVEGGARSAHGAHPWIISREFQPTTTE